MRLQVAKMADSQTVFYMDIGEYLTTADSTITADVMPDFLHLSATGYGALAMHCRFLVVFPPARSGPALWHRTVHYLGFTACP